MFLELNMIKENLIKEKSFDFAIKIVDLTRALDIVKKEHILSKQLLRSGTSIGANINEAQFSPTKADFINKMNISLKEANETLYWIELMHKTNYITNEEYNNIINDIIDIKNILMAIVKNAKN